MYNIILAAGEGKRFKDYKLPKLLLKVKRIPLFIRAAKSLPKNNDFIFILKKKHFENFKEIKINKKKTMLNQKLYYSKKQQMVKLQHFLSQKILLKKINQYL